MNVLTSKSQPRMWILTTSRFGEFCDVANACQNLLEGPRFWAKFSSYGRRFIAKWMIKRKRKSQPYCVLLILHLNFGSVFCFCLPSGCQVFFFCILSVLCQIKKKVKLFLCVGFYFILKKNISDSFWLIGIYFFVHATQFYTQCSPSLTYCLFGHFLGQLSWQYFCKNGKLWPHFCQLLSMLSFYLNVTFLGGSHFCQIWKFFGPIFGPRLIIFLSI